MASHHEYVAHTSIKSLWKQTTNIVFEIYKRLWRDNYKTIFKETLRD